jgi:hypothetical protein
LPGSGGRGNDSFGASGSDPGAPQPGEADGCSEEGETPRGSRRAPKRLRSTLGPPQPPPQQPPKARRLASMLHPLMKCIWAQLSGMRLGRPQLCMLHAGDACLIPTGVDDFFLAQEEAGSLRGKGSAEFATMPSSSLDGDSHSDDGGAGGAPSHGGGGGGAHAKRPRKIPKLPMVRHGKKWYRARLLKDTALRVQIGARPGPSTHVPSPAEVPVMHACIECMQSPRCATRELDMARALVCRGTDVGWIFWDAEFTGFEEQTGPLTLPRDSDRIWRGSYKGKDWRYLVRLSHSLWNLAMRGESGTHFWATLVGFGALLDVVHAWTERQLFPMPRATAPGSPRRRRASAQRCSAAAPPRQAPPRSRAAAGPATAAAPRTTPAAPPMQSPSRLPSRRLRCARTPTMLQRCGGCPLWCTRSGLVLCVLHCVLCSQQGLVLLAVLLARQVDGGWAFPWWQGVGRGPVCFGASVIACPWLD